MTEPTYEQVKKFWDYWGVEPYRAYPTGVEYPDIDLNNLFEDAVSAMDFWLASKEKTKRVGVLVQYQGRCSGLVFEDTFDLALFWAIWEVMEVSND